MATRQPTGDATRRIPVRHARLAGLAWQIPLAHVALGMPALAALGWADAVARRDAWIAIALLLCGAAVMAGWLRWHATRRATVTSPGASPDAPPVPAMTRGHELRELMRLLPDGVLLLTEDRVVYANPASEAMFGYAPGTLRDLPAGQLVDGDGRGGFDDWLNAPVAEGDAPPTSLRMQRLDGSGFRAALTAAQTLHDDRPCTLLVVRDLTGPERMRDELAAGNRELQALAARVFTLQEDERRAISRELHDDIGQSVTAMKMAAGSALDEDDPQRRRDDLEDILVLADATLERLRDISILLRPPQLDALGLEAALRWHAERLLRNAGIASVLDIGTLPRRPDATVEQACFRIAQEALTNALRHARAGRVELRLQDAGEALRLEIDDDGAGFQPSAARGLGLVIMRERAHGVGGRLELTSSPGAGTRIEACLPYASCASAPHSEETAG